MKRNRNLLYEKRKGIKDVQVVRSEYRRELLYYILKFMYNLLESVLQFIYFFYYYYFLIDTDNTKSLLFEIFLLLFLSFS